MRWTTLLLLAIALPAARSQALRVQVAGRFLGYETVPELQTDASNSGTCSAAVPTGAAEQFLNSRRSSAASLPMVAMGNNFAPFIHARQSILNSGRGRAEPKELFSWNAGRWTFQDVSGKGDDNGKQFIPFDNTGCFLRRAHFDAVVPGYYDFRFGPEYLRMLARYLAGPAVGAEKPVQMLAANLVIKTTSTKKHDKFADPPAPHTVKSSVTIDSVGEIKFQVPSVLLPWTRRFAVLNAVQFGGLTTENLPLGEKVAAAATTTVLIEDTGCLVIEEEGKPLPSACPGDKSLPLQLVRVEKYAKYALLELAGRTTHLDVGTTYRACAKSNTGVFFCSGSMTAQAPYFQWPHAAAADGMGSHEKDYFVPGAFAIHKEAGQPAVAVFGVVDQALLEQVGSLNYSWLNRNPELDTMVDVADPLTALEEVMDACRVNDECAGARKVLLAEMPLAKAQALAAALRDKFDLIVAQPNSALATPDGAYRINRPRHAFVLTPDPPHFGETENGVPIQTVTIGGDADLRTVELARETVAGVRREMQPAAGGPAPTLKDRALTVRSTAKDANPRTALEHVALTAMRSYCHADVALIQHRDLYRPDTAALAVANDHVQEALDRIFWTGNLVICREISGALLKDVLDQSEKLEAADKDMLAADPSFGRGVAMLGVYKDSQYGLLITNGAAVDPNRLYSIAVTDYLSAGDTGFPSLATAAVPPKTRLKDYERHVVELATLICQEMHAGDRNCHAPILTGDDHHYFDRLSMDLKGKPVETGTPKGATGTSVFQSVRSWNAQNNRIRKPAAAGDEFLAQQMPRWTITLQKSDFGFASALHSLSETDRGNNFAGIDLVQVNTKQERDITFDYAYRITRWGRRSDFYIAGDSDFSATHTAAPSTTDELTDFYVTNLKKNKLDQEFGYAWHIYPPNQKNESGFRLTTAARMESQIRDPLRQLQLSKAECVDANSNPAQCGGTVTKGGYNYDVERFIPRTYSLFAKTGLRYQGIKNWIESGVQAGEKFNRAVSYNWLNTDGSVAFSCDLTAPSALSCPSKLTSAQNPLLTFRDKGFSVNTVNRPQNGVYLNFSFIGPTWGPVTLSAANQGDYYWSHAGDARVDTKYFDDVTLAATIPAFGGFSVSPKVDVFAFRSKFDERWGTGGWHLHGYQTSVTLQYCFDHRTGVPWKKALLWDSCGNSKKK